MKFSGVTSTVEKIKNNLKYDCDKFDFYKIHLSIQNSYEIVISCY